MVYIEVHSLCYTVLRILTNVITNLPQPSPVLRKKAGIMVIVRRPEEESRAKPWR